MVYNLLVQAYPSKDDREKIAIDITLSHVWTQFLQQTFPGLDQLSTVNLGDLSKLVATFNHRNPDDFIKSSLCASEALKGIIQSGLLQFWLDPSIDSHSKFQEFKSNFTAKIQNLDYSAAFKSFISSLWYSRLPCFDVINMTSKSDGDSSILKKCWWKGVSISCAAIFRTFPTDQGMCCTFNMEAAEDIFVKSEYSSMIVELNMHDQTDAFQNSTLPNWYTEADEPVSEAGINMGLTVMLDAHNDLVEALSIDSDYEGFTVTITNPGEFPLTFQNGFKVKPGHLNMVALSAINILSDESIRGIMPDNRNCYFSDETSQLKLYNQYSQASCFLECKLVNAQSNVQQMFNLSQECTPWNFPFYKKSVMCDPWQSAEISKLMQGGSPKEGCENCLPDCTHTTYQHSLSTIPFRTCNEKNFGLSTLCNLNQDAEVPKPKIWADQVLNQFSSMGRIPNYLSDLQSSVRILKSSVSMQNIFTNITRNYDAYDKDIAIVSVYFDTPVAFQFGTQATQGWVQFFSDVGGLLGLCIGLSIVTVVEIFWLCLKIVGKACKCKIIFAKMLRTWTKITIIFENQMNKERVHVFNGNDTSLNKTH